jgi:hypothetical protein
VEAASSLGVRSNGEPARRSVASTSNSPSERSKRPYTATSSSVR